MLEIVWNCDLSWHSISLALSEAFFLGFACGRTQDWAPSLRAHRNHRHEGLGSDVWLSSLPSLHGWKHLVSTVWCPIVFHQACLVLDPLALEPLQESMRIPVSRQDIETANSVLSPRYHVRESYASVTKTFYEPLCHCSKAELAFQNLVSDKSCNAEAYFMALLKSPTLCGPVRGTHAVRKSPNECPVGLWILGQTRNMLDLDCLHLENFVQHNVISVLPKLPSLNSYSPGSVALKRVMFMWGPVYGAQISFDAHAQENAILTLPLSKNIHRPLMEASTSVLGIPTCISVIPNHSWDEQRWEFTNVLRLLSISAISARNPSSFTPHKAKDTAEDLTKKNELTNKKTR